MFGWPCVCVCACGGRPARRRHEPESEAGGAGVRPVAPSGGLEPSPLWSAGQPQGLSPPPSPTGPGEEAGRRQASPQGDRGGLLLLPRRVSGRPWAPVGKLTTPERNSRLKDRSANSCEGKAGLSEREVTFQIDGERWRSQLMDRRRRRCPSAVAAASPRASRPVHWRRRGRSHLDVGPSLSGGRALDLPRAVRWACGQAQGPASASLHLLMAGWKAVSLLDLYPSDRTVLKFVSTTNMSL